MKNYLFQILFSILLICIATAVPGCGTAEKSESSPAMFEPDPAAWVDPMIGTGAHGHTFPGSAVPFGMIQIGPTNGDEGWDWCSGYHYSSEYIIGFSHTHLSGTGIGDLNDILLLPAVEPLVEVTSNEGVVNTGSIFSHSEEKAEAGYYRVRLADYGVTAEMTSATRSGMHRYTFPPEKEQLVIINLDTALNWDETMDSRITSRSDSLLTGYRYSKGWAPNQKLFFALEFSRPWFSLATAENKIGESGGRGLVSTLKFTPAEEPLLARIAISSVDEDGALNNLRLEIPGWDFEKIRESARVRWNEELGRMQVSSPDENLKTIFYTALYHSFLAPVEFSDSDGRYRTEDDKIVKANGFDNYSLFSLWDTFRSAHPLYTIVQPERVTDMVKSMLATYREQGLPPKWQLWRNENYCMIGYHSVPVITDAIMKGLLAETEWEEAYQAMSAAASQERDGINFAAELKTIPADKVNQSVSKALEYAYDDWCIAQIARILGKEADSRHYLERSELYRNYYDTETGFMRGRNSDGTFTVPFNPSHSDHSESDYVEGNAWQWTWFVPHSPRGLMELMGGREEFIKRLDQLFLAESKLEGENVSSDISGLIGQYAHGNEPVHHVAYFYNYAGQQDKTAEKVNEIMTTLYLTGPEGLSGNEDCGQMSAWYVLSAMGFHPVNPADGEYAIGRPMFDQVSIPLQDGEKAFRITVSNNSPENKYIRKMLLNGTPLDRPFIKHSDIVEGGLLELEMGANN
jgi:predicted alpha-1,2-mannosidase